MESYYRAVSQLEIPSDQQGESFMGSCLPDHNSELVAKDPLNNSRAWVKVLDKFWDGPPRSDLKLSRLWRLWMMVTQAKTHPQKVGTW